MAMATPSGGYPFPGMNPWLEHPLIWPDVHHALIGYMRDELAAQVAPRYSARHGERVIVETPDRKVEPDVFITEKRRPAAPPDRAEAVGPAATASTATLEMPVLILLPQWEVRETFIEIRDRRSGNRIVTVIEILSPSNKRKGSDGREKYLQKQEEMLRSDASLVEIDLLRGGAHTVALPEDYLADYGDPAYKIVVRRPSREGEVELYPIGLRDRLPRLKVPLTPPDPDAQIELQPLLERAWRAGGYEGDIDYSKPPVPSLGARDSTWARKLARKPARKRRG